MTSLPAALSPDLREDGRTHWSDDLGLSTDEALRRRVMHGPNSVEEKPVPFGWRAVGHFWAPVPWMLETAIALELSLGERLEALMIALLLLLNAGLGFVQEARANAALQLLKKRLAFKAKVRRDGEWQLVPAADLVPGDVVQVSLGNVVPADFQIITVFGSPLVDQSALTGESAVIEARTGDTLFAGSLVRRGEATGRVTATGAQTYFGRTVELVQTAHVESAEQRMVIDVVRNLTILNTIIIAGMVAYACWIDMAPARIVPLILAALLSAVPVALPATFTLAAAIGAKTLAEHGVLLTRLSTLQNAATVDVLCIDKTGTLTDNTLVISDVSCVVGYTEADVLAYAGLASSPNGQDPVDAAIRARLSPVEQRRFRLLTFTPFDPTTKVATARVLDGDRELVVVKGAPDVVGRLTRATSEPSQESEEARPYRTIAVAAGPAGALRLVGTIAMSDSPRKDSAPLLEELRALGVRPIMITGDTVPTATAVARAIGLPGAVCPAGQISGANRPEDFAVYAGVFPEQKFRLIRGFQRQGYSVGMCGDGVNDAPALRQAQMGIAVSTATDVAKASAGMVLTAPGLRGIVTAIKEARSAFQRVLTYTATVFVNKSATLLVLAAGLVMTGHAILTPLLQALAMLAGDFMTMARAADRAKPSPYPNAWQIGNLAICALPLGFFKFVYCVAVLAFALHGLHLAPEPTETLTFVMLVFAGQGNAYVLRERQHFWRSIPARPMLLASVADIVVVSVLAGRGILMAPLPPSILAGLFASTLVYTVVLDFLKRAGFSRINIDRKIVRSRIGLLAPVALALLCVAAPAARADVPSPARASAETTPAAPHPPSPKRAVPDYGRGAAPAPPADAALWIPRTLLAPMYFVAEYVLRRPLSVAVPAAERADWPRHIYDFFTFGKDHEAGILPVAFAEFNFNPSVGAYFFWNGAGFKGNDLRLHFEAWPSDWVYGSFNEQIAQADHRTVQLRLTGGTRPDKVYYGLGPNSLQSHESRYGIQRVDGALAYEWRFWKSSRIETGAGARMVKTEDGRYGDDPSLSVAAREGRVAVPPGFSSTYEAEINRLVASLDTRDNSSAPGPGAHLEVSAEQGTELKAKAAADWVRYRATAGGFVDLNGHGRILGLTADAFFSDPLGPQPVPFTELVYLGGDHPMNAYFDGRLRDRSAAVLEASYSWPVAAWLDGNIEFDLGNVFGVHLDRFDPKLLRYSGSVGLTVVAPQGSAFQNAPLTLLMGVGSETFEHGGQLDSVRFAIGIPNTF